MKYTIMCPADQTVGWLDEEGCLTVRPSRAKLYDSLEEAKAALQNDDWVMAVEDIARFRAGPATWCGYEDGDEEDGCFVCDDVSDEAIYWGEKVE